MFKYVLLVHPTIVVKRLHDEGKIDELWWDTYRNRQIETKERTYDQLIPAPESEKVVPIKKATAKAKNKASSS